MGLALQNSAAPTTLRQAAIHTDAPINLALSEVISALSFALDLTEDAVPGHAVRSCLLGMRLGSALGLPDSDLHDLYYALLLKDIGCSSNAARMCNILGADEREAKRRVKTVDWTRISVDGLGLAWANSLPGASPWKKTLRVLQLGLSRNRNNAEMIGLRCERGADIVRKIGLSTQCADAIHSLDEHWNGSGYPDRLRGEATPLLGRILAVAQHLDVFASDQGQDRAIETLQERSRTWFDPELVRVTVALNRAGLLWSGCEPSLLGTADARARVLDLEPGTSTLIGSAEIDKVCEAFADVVDAKSPFTFRHSIGVTEAADQIATHFGLRTGQRKLIHRAALLHDLGKLSVSNAILDKPGKLDAQEWASIQRHPQLSQRILERVPSFAGIAAIAGRHHEKLDGSGYPNHLSARHLSLEDRIVTMADIYGALAEDRPYRAGLEPDQILAIIGKEVPNKLDGEVFDALKQFIHRNQSANRILQIPQPAPHMSVAQVQQLLALSNQTPDLLSAPPKPANA